MSGSLTERLRDLLGPALEKLGYELIQVEQIATRRPVLRLYIDLSGEAGAGVTLDDCQKVSQYVSGLLDVEDPLPGAYALEVSSPGLDRPLVTAEHFRRFVGSEARLQLHRPLQGARRLRGRLCSEADGVIEIEVDGQRLSLPLADIRAARLVPDLAAELRSKGDGH
ncbi:MAG: ribosome maturation factor RimP [Gammaproteobacteria bacterium]